jgi:ATP-dependent Lon protease
VIAARRSKIREIIVPEANRGDYEELPAHITKGIKVHFVEEYPQVAKIVFGKR